MTRTAVIAGQGGLSAAVVQNLDNPLVYALEGYAPDFPAEPFRIERLVPFLDGLIEADVSRVVFAGAIRRPRLDPELFDPRTAQLVPRILMAMQSGDDAALRAVLDLFEEFGLSILGIAEAAPDLVRLQGCWSVSPAMPTTATPTARPNCWPRPGRWISGKARSWRRACAWRWKPCRGPRRCWTSPPAMPVCAPVPMARKAFCSRRRNRVRTAASTCPPLDRTRSRRPEKPVLQGSHGPREALSC